MKRPLVPVALLYGVGLLLGNIGEAPLAALFLAGFGFGAGALGWARSRGWLLAGLAVVCGWANLQWRTTAVSPHDVRRLAGENPCLVSVRGVLSGRPSARVLVREEEERWHTLALLELTELRLGRGAWSPACGLVQTTTPGVLPAELRDGQTVEVEGVLLSPVPRVAEGLFDYRRYLELQGVYRLLKASSTNQWRVYGVTNPPTWTERFSLWAMPALERGLPERDEPLRLQWAMILGWKTALTEEVSEPFMRSGTMHIFAISGLHIALIAGMLLALFRLCNLPRSWCGFLIIPLIWFYTAATEWQASAIRSTVMMTVIIAGWSLQRPSDLLNSLAAAGLAILIWDPRQLFQASFQLSFFVVLSLALFAPPLERFRQRVFAPDPIGEAPPPRGAGLDWFRWQVLGLDPLRSPESRPAWQRALHSGLGHLAAALVTSLAAALGSTPLIAYYFHLFTPVSLLANLVVVPLSGLALMAGLGSLLTAAWCPWLAELFNHSGWFWMKLMVLASEWSVSWPGSYWYVCEPGPVTLGLSYTALVAGMGGWFAGHLRWWAAGAAGLLALAWLALAWRERATTRLTVLPLRGGHAVFVDAPGRREDLLVDCGDASAMDFITKPFLRSRGMNHVPQLLLTHGDVRHVGGAPGLFTNFVVERVATPARSFSSVPYRQALTAWTNQHHKLMPVARNDHLNRWRVLHPDATDRSSLADDNAAVLRGELAGTRVLLCADLGPRGQDLVVRRELDLRMDIVVSGLPSRGQPLLDGILDRLQPRLIIIADSEYPAAARATEQVRFRLARRKVPVLFTRDTGAVTIELRQGRWRVRGPEGEELP